jgi:glycosyltransferase involved in cell wall biosynthesis
MRICFVAHGNIPIPPTGWGAVESLISDYKFHVEQLGHEAHVVNLPDPRQVTEAVRALKPDVVHIHSELFFRVLDDVPSALKIMTSHAPVDPHHRAKLRSRFVESQVLRDGRYICCLSDAIYDMLCEVGVPARQVFVARNGARADLFRFSSKPRLGMRSIYLAAVRERKRQYLVAHVDCIDFAGPRYDPYFDYARPNYLGNWSKNHLYRHLTDYANLVLLSRYEAAPLVTCEALMAGLGLVVSEAAAANLDTTLPFIEVVPESLVDNREVVEHAIRHNQCVASAMRNEIREYALAHFDWKNLVSDYLSTLTALRSGDTAPSAVSV